LEKDVRVTLKLVEFNQEKTLVALARMIIIDELLFTFVEIKSLVNLCNKLNPILKFPPI